ncbi:MAG: hypothetical protein WCA78_00025 [Rhizomicrobium sp.]
MNITRVLVWIAYALVVVAFVYAAVRGVSLIALLIALGAAALVLLASALRTQAANSKVNSQTPDQLMNHPKRARNIGFALLASGVLWSLVSMYFVGTSTKLELLLTMGISTVMLIIGLVCFVYSFVWKMRFALKARTEKRKNNE